MTSLRRSFLAGLLLLPLRDGHAVDFARDIQPLFAEHCLECHGPDKAKAGLLLTHREDALKLLKSGGRGIVPGDPGKSTVLERVTSSDPEEHMPPKGKKPLKAQEIELLRQWIQQGAKYDLHWAYKPVGHPAVPVAGGNSPHPVDAFVRARLKESGIAPAPEAAPATLLKRASYDLLGLPPTPEEVDRLMAELKASGWSTGPIPDTIWSQWLGKLLDSPHFGERWGRHWLDAARYADSDGYEKDRPRPDAWRYRDWVIKAINDDMPFDAFTIEQLAGDLLPDATPEQTVATEFNRQTLTNTEGGTDQEQFRVEAVFDRTETLGSVWLGLTIGCARCHTHKYDQISHQEYYQLFAFFNNGDEVTRQVAESPVKWSQYQKQHGTAAARLAELQKKLDEAKSRIPSRLPAWEEGVQARLAKARAINAPQTFAERDGLKMEWKNEDPLRTVYKSLPDGSKIEQGTKMPKIDTFVVEIPAGAPLTAIQFRVLADPSLPASGRGKKANGNFVLSEVKAAGVVFHSPVADYSQPGFEPAKVLDGNDDTGWAFGGGGKGKAHTLTLQLATPHPAGKPLKLSLVQNYRAQLIERLAVLDSQQETEASIAPPEVVKLLKEEPRRRNPVLIKPLYDWLEKVDPETVAARALLEEASARLPKPPLMDVRVIGERTVNPRPTHILHRGNFLDPAEPVIPATLGVLPPLKAKASSPSRLDFARWLVSPENPLTPRVTVNQIWLHLFGEGLVKTAADFGVRGERPSHPELLDFVAREFMDRGWSRKALLKWIMMSATYRQSSASTLSWSGSASVPRSAEELARLQGVDPRNEWLWRQNRIRVEGEIVRDLHLAASGLLSHKVGGPSVFPPMPADVADLSYANNFKWATSAGEDRYRRGMYTFFKRTAPYPDLTTFDCPDANLANVKRTVSNTPLQALTTLNAEAYSEASRALARRLLTESHVNDRARLARCLRLCLVRPVNEREIDALLPLLAASRSYYQSRADEAKAMSGTFTVEGLPAVETAAWAATARIVLNLDEFITRD